MDRSRRKEDRGLRTEDRGLRKEDRGLRTEDRGLRTEDRGLRTEDRGLRTEDGGRKTEDGGRMRKQHGGRVMARIDSYEDLEVYQLALELQHDIFLLTKSFPKEETYSLTDQIRRSSRSIGANLVEAWAKRRYPPHFISKLSDSDGEQNETRHWLRSAMQCEYITGDAYNTLLAKCKRIGQMLGNMMYNSENWVPKNRH